MNIQPIQSFLNGQMVDPSELRVPVTDAGFMQGTTVAEQLRTFQGALFQLDPHIARLSHSLDIVGITTRYTPRDMIDWAQRLAAHNHRHLTPGDDLGLSIFVTPGPYTGFGESGEPLVGMHTYPLAFSSWSNKYSAGQRMVIVDVRQVPTTCWPSELKCRSRMHYYLADREARQKDPGARALLLDQAGWVSEASTANVLAYYDREGLVIPPQEKTLPGISLAFIRSLADELAIPVAESPMRPEDVLRADEFLLCSTSPCILPVTTVNGHAIGSGQPGPIFAKLLQQWSLRVGIDIAEQARRFADRS